MPAATAPELGVLRVHVPTLCWASSASTTAAPWLGMCPAWQGPGALGPCGCARPHGCQCQAVPGPQLCRSCVPSAQSLPCAHLLPEQWRHCASPTRQSDATAAPEQ